MTEGTDLYTVAEINCNDNTTTYRPMTDEEIAQMDAMRATTEEREAQKIAAQESLAALKASAKAKLIAGTPLTEEEAAVIVL
jgi:1,6-anhydro-N-acetylmuramate kinase